MAVRLSALLACRVLIMRTISDTHFCYNMSKSQGCSTVKRMRYIEEIQWRHRESKPRFCILKPSTLANYDTKFGDDKHTTSEDLWSLLFCPSKDFISNVFILGWKLVPLTLLVIAIIRRTEIFWHQVNLFYFWFICWASSGTVPTITEATYWTAVLALDD
jgi:hypothetical protein